MLIALTTTGKVVLLVVAGTFIAFAILTAIVIPRRRPEFPGDRLGAYLALVALLFVAQMSAIVWVSETQEGEEAEAAETAEGAETEPAEAEPPETEPTGAETEPTGAETEPSETGETETEPGATGTTEADGEGDAAAGEQVYASAGCGGCHALQAAGSNGAVGPNLDDARPSFDKVVERVTEGKGVMPAFGDQLSEQQIRDVAAFVSESTRGE